MLISIAAALWIIVILLVAYMLVKIVAWGLKGWGDAFRDFSDAGRPKGFAHIYKGKENRAGHWESPGWLEWGIPLFLVCAVIIVCAVFLIIL